MDAAACLASCGGAWSVSTSARAWRASTSARAWAQRLRTAAMELIPRERFFLLNSACARVRVGAEKRLPGWAVPCRWSASPRLWPRRLAAATPTLPRPRRQPVPAAPPAAAPPGRGRCPRTRSHPARRAPAPGHTRATATHTARGEPPPFPPQRKRRGRDGRSGRKRCAHQVPTKRLPASAAAAASSRPPARGPARGRFGEPDRGVGEARCRAGGAAAPASEVGQPCQY